MGTVSHLPTSKRDESLYAFLRRTSDHPPAVITTILFQILRAPSNLEAVRVCMDGLGVSRTLAASIVRSARRGRRSQVYDRCRSCDKAITSRDRVGMVIHAKADGTTAVKAVYCKACCALNGIR